MTAAELKSALDCLTDGEFERFRKSFGGDYPTRQGYVDNFVHHPEHERRLCQILGQPTQEERQTQAALNSAEAARASARSARWSMIWAGIAVVVSLVALALSTR